MRVVVKSGRHHLRLRFPLFFLKSRIIVKSIAKSISEDMDVDFLETKATVKEVYKILKNQVKRHGHFNLVEFDSSDGDKVIVRI